MNVCIYRLPLSKSLVNPSRSFCPNCGNTIKFYNNIPVLSYLLLKGRCSNCKKPISFRYPFVEILSAITALCVLLKFGLNIEAVIYYAFISALTVITFIDIDHQIIPDVITLPGIPVCFAATFALQKISFMDSLTGILAGGGSLYLVAWIYYFIKKEDGMGGGDIKLLAMIGALLGFKGVLFTIFAGSAIGTAAGIIIMIGTRMMNMKLRIPFGPFLSVGAVLYIFYGAEIISWYFKLIF